MTPSIQTRVLLLLSSAVAIVGVVDGLVDGDRDVVAMFVIVGLVLATLLWRVSWRRPAIPMRADLVKWMERRAVEGGESVEAVADRAVAAYRAGLSVDDVDE